jgi:hypothetical protein
MTKEEIMIGGVWSPAGVYPALMHGAGMTGNGTGSRIRSGMTMVVPEFLQNKGWVPPPLVPPTRGGKKKGQYLPQGEGKLKREYRAGTLRE